MNKGVRQRPRRRRKAARRMKPGWVILFLLVAIGLTARWFYRGVNSPHEHVYAGRIITIPAGSSARQIIAQLKSEGVIADDLATRAWLWMAPIRGKYKAGDYLFASPISARQVSDKLIRGEIYVQRVTFPEGLNRFDIAHLIQGLSIPGAESALDLTQRTELIADIDREAESLEGYLFPDTYEYSTTTSAEQLVGRMVRRFRQVYSNDWARRAHEMGWSTRQVITLASIIEREARQAEERPLVSSVYHNRLKISMKLDCDPTVIYGALLAGDWTGRLRRSDLNRDSRYNTYKYSGLPPGPIACPGQRSIEAALFPADTRFIYFVVDGDRQDGRHRFAATVKEHTANVALYRQYEREHGRRGS